MLGHFKRASYSSTLSNGEAETSHHASHTMPFNAPPRRQRKVNKEERMPEKNTDLFGISKGYTFFEVNTHGAEEAILDSKRSRARGRDSGNKLPHRSGTTSEITMEDDVSVELPHIPWGIKEDKVAKPIRPLVLSGDKSHVGPYNVEEAFSYLFPKRTFEWKAYDLPNADERRIRDSKSFPGPADTAFAILKGSKSGIISGGRAGNDGISRGVPGPCSYGTPSYDVSSQHSRSKSYEFDRRPRSTACAEAARLSRLYPGPGSFVGLNGGIPKPHFGGVSWGSAASERFPDESIDLSPGPGHYDTKFSSFGNGARSAKIEAEHPTSKLIAQMREAHTSRLRKVRGQVQARRSRSPSGRLETERSALLSVQAKLQREMLGLLAKEELKEHDRLLEGHKQHHEIERKTAQGRIRNLLKRMKSLNTAINMINNLTD